MLLPFFPGPGAETGPFSPSDLEMWSKTSYKKVTITIFLIYCKEKCLN